MNLRPYQWQMVEYIHAHPRCGLFVPMGMGKTLATLTALEECSSSETIYPVLIIAPLRVAQSTWIDEVQRWPHLQHLKIIPILGTITQRKKALAQNVALYTTNYENLPWLVKQLGKAWPFVTIVADESSRLKGFRLRQGTRCAQVLAKVAHDLVKRLIALSGTPAPNGLIDL